MNKQKTLTIRMNEQDWEAVEKMKQYLKGTYQDLPAFLRQVSDTDVIKYCLHKQTKSQM